MCFSNFAAFRKLAVFASALRGALWSSVRRFKALRCVSLAAPCFASLAAFCGFVFDSNKNKAPDRVQRLAWKEKDIML